jgi:curved DNA-binding protein CbpA
MNDLHKSYGILQLSPGTSMELINQRYKRLVMSWHPDKFRGDQAKATAERELKKINNARDILRDHFRTGGHKEAGHCDCRYAPEEAAQASAEWNRGSKTHRTSNDSGGFQSSNSANHAESTTQSTYSSDTRNCSGEDVANGQQFHNAFRRSRNDDADLRKLASILCALSFLLLLVSTAVSDVFALSSAYLRSSFKVGQHIRTPFLNNEADKISSLSQNNPSADGQWYHNKFALNDLREFGPKAEVLRAARENMERYSGYIAFSEKKLAEVEIILATPGISASDRRYAFSDREIQTKFLKESQENLKFARQRLDDLVGAKPSESR